MVIIVMILSQLTFSQPISTDPGHPFLNPSNQQPIDTPAPAKEDPSQSIVPAPVSLLVPSFGFLHALPPVDDAPCVALPLDEVESESEGHSSGGLGRSPPL